MTTILVTGGAGYIGSHTCKVLDANGYTPVVYDNLSEGHKDFVKWGELVEGDVRDTAKLSKIIKQISPQAVIHFAASAYVGDSVKQPLRYYENNLSGSLSLLQAMQNGACDKLIFSSTCAVYGEVDKLPIKIDQATKPINPYGRSKLMVEKAINDCAIANGVNSVALRYFNAAGADLDCQIGERHIPEPHIIPNVINAALHPCQEHVFELYGDDYGTADGTCVRDYIHVTDLANAHVLAVKYLEGHKGVFKFNLGAGQGTSIKQLISLVEKEVGPVVFKVQPRRSGDPAVLYADTTTSKNELGWEPIYSDMQTIISSAAKWAMKEINR